MSVWPQWQALLNKHIFMVSKTSCHKQKNVCQACICVVAKPTNIVLEKQNFKCWPNNVCPFGWGFIQNELSYDSSILTLKMYSFMKNDEKGEVYMHDSASL